MIEPSYGGSFRRWAIGTGAHWLVILRLYSPLEPFFDKSWRPGEIEMVH